ncbi:MAG: hypothetical protein M3O31_08325 [Acidobacteriota bacterium]|nr:hypothetical protein [Acidobacteriota bacterium]
MDTSRDPPHFRVNREFVHGLADAVETLSNLAYLICADAENPDLVKQYTNQMELCVQRMAQLIRELPPDIL